MPHINDFPPYSPLHARKEDRHALTASEAAGFGARPMLLSSRLEDIDTSVNAEEKMGSSSSLLSRNLGCDEHA